MESDVKTGLVLGKAFLLLWIISVVHARRQPIAVPLRSALPTLQKTTQHSSQKTNQSVTPSTKAKHLMLQLRNYTVPKQPEMGLRNLIKYDETHKHFHRHSPNSLHVMSSPIRARGAPWPMPKSYKEFKNKKNTNRYIIEPNKILVYAKDFTHEILDFNLERMWKNVFSMKYNNKIHKRNDTLLAHFKIPSNKRLIRFIHIIIQNDSTLFPTSKMDESYSLCIKQRGYIELSSAEVWGSIRGLETLSQLIIKDKDKFYVNNFTVHDSPRFSHRGLMIDTARHFISKDVLIMNLEAMAQNKLNVFHWHMTDDQSFPFESHRLPNITKYGAYNPQTHIYRSSDVSDIIQAARLRGIRVIPEFDTPGHSFSWGFGQPDLLSPCFDNKGKPNKFFGPINPNNDKTYKLLETLYQEILEVFPDNTVHIGGDEVNKDCWNSNPELRNLAEKTNVDLDVILNQMLSNFTSRLQKTINTLFGDRTEKRNAKVFGDTRSETIVWQEAYDEQRKLTKETIVQVWKDSTDYIGQVTKDGFKAIFSSCWYLDATQYGIDWDLFYNCLNKETSHPTDYGGLLIGGEICLWTEYVDDQTIMAKLWPRASAAAERLWSSVNQTDFKEAAKRLEEHNCRMKGSGIPSGVLNGPSFCGENLISDVSTNISWPDEIMEPMFLIRKTKNSHSIRPSSSFQKQQETLARFSSGYDTQRVLVIVIVFVLVVFCLLIFCLILVFASILCRHINPLSRIWCRKTILKRRFMLFTLAIGAIIVTSNIVKLILVL